MDSLSSERAMAFGEPAVYSSRDFVSVHQTERPSEVGRFWASNERFTISLRNIAQNELLDTTRMFLQFSVFTTIPKSTVAGVVDPDLMLRCRNPADVAAVFPGIPALGVPFFSSVSVQIPGLGLESFLRQDEESQVQVVSRLMCSSGEGRFEAAFGKCPSFSISGKAYESGMRSAMDRSECVYASGVRTDRGRQAVDAAGGPLRPAPIAPDIVGPSIEQTDVSGVLTHYQVPLSLFSHLYNGLSSHLPLSFLASGGDLCNFTFNLAPARTALNDLYQDRADIVGPASYYIFDPAISFTKIQINSAPVLSAIEALYRGVASLPITPTLSVPLTMILKSIDYTSAFTTVNATAGRFQLTIPANEPSCRGILLKFNSRDYGGVGLTSVQGTAPKSNGAIGSQWNGKHAYSLQPVLQNLQVRIGSYRCPLDTISDASFLATRLPGLITQPFADAQWGNTNTNITSATTQAEQSRLYQAGKHLFSPFATHEDPHDSALAPWFCTQPSNLENARSELFQGSHYAVPSFFEGSAAPPAPPAPPATITALITALVGSGGVVAGGSNDAGLRQYQVADACSPCMFVLPFESLSSVYNQQNDAFALRGLDLRNISSITVSGEITGVLQTASVMSGADIQTTTGWTIRAWLAYDREMVVLPGRVDQSAQFSLLPTGSTSVQPTAGNPAM